MGSFIECYPCYLRQALEACAFVGADDSVKKRVLDEVMRKLLKFGLEESSVNVGFTIHQLIQEIIDNPDPYLQVKQESTQKALALYPALKERIANAANPLETATRLAIAGNVIDFGPTSHFDMQASIDMVLSETSPHFDFLGFAQEVNKAKKILYIGDNAGETVFDRLLIETIDKPIYYVVKSKPIVNDATCEEAIQAGLDKCATIIETGSPMAGCLLSDCSLEFRELFQKADIVISKGQANFESLLDETRRIFFLLKVKCEFIGNKFNLPLDHFVLLDYQKNVV